MVDESPRARELADIGRQAVVVEGDLEAVEMFH